MTKTLTNAELAELTKRVQYGYPGIDLRCGENVELQNAMVADLESLLEHIRTLKSAAQKFINASTGAGFQHHCLNPFERECACGANQARAEWTNARRVLEIAIGIDEPDYRS